MSLLSIAVSSEKVILSESGEKYAQIKHYLLSKAVLNNYVVGIWCETRDELGGRIIMDYGDNLSAGRSVHDGLNVLMMDLLVMISLLYVMMMYLIQLHRISLHKTLTDGLEGCGLLWCFYQLFGLILTAPIHCSGSISDHDDHDLNTAKSVPMKKQTSWMAWGWVFCTRIFNLHRKCTALFRSFIFVLLFVICFKDCHNLICFLVSYTWWMWYYNYTNKSISMKCWKWPPVILIIKNHEILLWLFYFSIHLSSQLLSLYVSVRLSVFLRLSEREPCEQATVCWAWTVLLWTDRNMLTLWPWSCRAAKRLSSSSSTTSWSWVSRHTDAHVHYRVCWYAQILSCGLN